MMRKNKLTCVQAEIIELWEYFEAADPEISTEMLFTKVEGFMTQYGFEMDTGDISEALRLKSRNTVSRLSWVRLIWELWQEHLRDWRFKRAGERQ